MQQSQNNTSTTKLHGVVALILIIISCHIPRVMSSAGVHVLCFIEDGFLAVLSKKQNTMEEYIT